MLHDKRQECAKPSVNKTNSRKGREQTYKSADRGKHEMIKFVKAESNGVSTEADGPGRN